MISPRDATSRPDKYRQIRLQVFTAAFSILRFSTLRRFGAVSRNATG
jgi:hypothetical protein